MIPLSYRVVLPGAYWINQSFFFLTMVGLIYLNTKELAPKFLFKKRFVEYYLILLVLCIVIILLLQQMESLLNLTEQMHKVLAPGEVFQPETMNKAVYFYIFLVEVLVLGINISGIIVRKWEEEEKLRLAADERKSAMELSYLKAQINPHFFFNTLNTINALTYSDVDKSRHALKKLGSIMRFVLYDTSHQHGPLIKEINFIKDYVELMKLRVSPKVAINLKIEGDFEHVQLAPMLFLAFIENCFKHGVSSQAVSDIFIRISVLNDLFCFQTRNKLIPKNVEEKNDPDSGIGLVNTIRRLDLLYPERYTLKIDKNNPTNEYILTLEIKLL
jgi:sensor histidine kinase YesM